MDVVGKRLSIVSLLLIGLLTPLSFSYSGGSCIPTDPYKIAPAADLIALGSTPADYNQCFILTAHIDMDPNRAGRKVFDRALIAPDTNEVDDGFQGTPFSGIFDGNKHVIRNLRIVSSRDY